jgi:hypothetical protein
MKAKLLNKITRASITTASTFTGLLLSTAIANAATLNYSAVYEPTRTNITNAILSLQQFDSSLGELNSITVEFTGNLIGNGGFENEDATPQTITVDLSGLLRLSGPNNNPLINLTPQQVTPYDVSEYDGVWDFGGDSGRTIDGLQATQSNSETLTDQSSFAPFIGTGTVDFSFSALARSTVQGSGNISSRISTFAGANITVIYDYTETPRRIPESSMVLGLGLIAGFGLLSQTKNVFNRF